MADAPVFSPRLRRIHHECEKWRRGVLKRIASIRPVAVFAANATGYVKRPDHPCDGYAVLSYENWESSLRATFRALDSEGIRTIYLRDNPRPDFDVPACLSRIAEHGWYGREACDFSREWALDEELFRHESRAVAGLSHVSILDLSDVYCTGRRCASAQRDTVVYRDGNHLSHEFVTGMQTVLQDRVPALIRSVADTHASGSFVMSMGRSRSGSADRRLSPENAR